MQHIETRTQLIDFIVAHAPSGSVSRACYEGTVNVLGGFTEVPPSTRPGWIVVVTSRFGQMWYVAIQPNEDTRKFEVREIERVPWKNYIGRDDRGGYSIYDGDDPMKSCSAQRRNQATNPDTTADTTSENKSIRP